MKYKKKKKKTIKYCRFVVTVSAFDILAACLWRRLLSKEMQSGNEAQILPKAHNVQLSWLGFMA